VRKGEEAKRLAGFIDLHTHTTESDGTLTPKELVDLAEQIGLDALAITDHDTFAGFKQAVRFAPNRGLRVICGIELNSRLQADKAGFRAAHLLGYFLAGDPLPTFHAWLEQQRTSRRKRNEKLAEKLRSHGIDITLDEVEARGKALTGRVHFARVLTEKGYAANVEDAFARFIGEDAPTFVERESYSAEEAIRIVRSGGGVPVLAHPVRLSLPQDTERLVLERLRDAGLAGLEVYHSEHSPQMQVYYRQLAEELDLIPTGGSDFHGSVKPDTQLGSGINDNIRVPRSFLDRLEQFARQLVLEARQQQSN
jgi:predicted metal-dependent phosphoesterase TrpH